MCTSKCVSHHMLYCKILNVALWKVLYIVIMHLSKFVKYPSSSKLSTF